MELARTMLLVGISKDVGSTAGLEIEVEAPCGNIKPRKSKLHGFTKFETFGSKSPPARAQSQTPIGSRI